MPGAQAAYTALYLPRKEGNEWELHVNIVGRDAHKNHSYFFVGFLHISTGFFRLN